MKEYLTEQLEETAQHIIEPPSSKKTRVSIIKLFHELEDAIEQDLWEHQEHITTPKGSCIAPVEAAHCMLDTERTTIFIQGIYAAIKTLQEKHPYKTLSIAYMGCGPFATLALPLTHHFSSQEIQFTLVDIQEGALQCVQKLIEQLDLTEYFPTIVHHDAATYTPSSTPDLVISEAMGRALLYEPQLAISENAKQFASDSTIIIPQEISLSVLLHKTKNDHRRPVDLGTFFTVSKDTPTTDPDHIIEGDVTLKDNLHSDLPYHVCIATRVRVFQSHVLHPDDSLITHREPLNRRYKKQPNETAFHLQYPSGSTEEQIRLEVRDASNKITRLL
ncbi:hypothetical protein GF369_01700 [Candidatus Peregrinibacteria bacterium]|nr:hypothetical protein [Candidatus Peregrinibacteria bacterium]